VVPLVNRLAASFKHVFLSQDWHPAGHVSFASTHAGKKPFDIIDLPCGPQELWPDHCVQDTTGAAFHPDLCVPHAELVLRKGYTKEMDCYSIFFENDRRTPSGLGGYLRERGLTRLFLAGLALDFCVRYSAEDASRSGFEAIVVEDACRAIDSNGSLAEANRVLQSLAIACVDSARIAAR
jgi:nicotinamidase/pyrazinamidase